MAQHSRSETRPAVQQDLTEARLAISQARRDFAGFIEGDQPNITEDQFRWLSYRMSHGSDNDAALAMSKDDEEVIGLEWLERVAEWRMDPNFAAIEQITLGNKREGFRLLSVHLAGKALRRINDMMSSNDPKIVIRALTLWERTLGLLVDKVSLVSKDELARLAEKLMTPTTITPIEGPSIVEGEWRESNALPPRSPSIDTD
jgi:hypothetical protein